jgi:hypothetical protein
MTEPPPKTKPQIRINLTAEQTAKAVAFLDAIMTNLALSQHQEIHGVMKSVPDPFSGVA